MKLLLDEYQPSLDDIQICCEMIPDFGFKLIHEYLLDKNVFCGVDALASIAGDTQVLDVDNRLFDQSGQDWCTQDRRAHLFKELQLFAMDGTTLRTHDTAGN